MISKKLANSSNKKHSLLKEKDAIMGEADWVKDYGVRSVRSLLGLPGRRKRRNVTRRLGGVLTGADR